MPPRSSHAKRARVEDDDEDLLDDSPHPQPVRTRTRGTRSDPIAAVDEDEDEEGDEPQPQAPGLSTSAEAAEPSTSAEASSFNHPPLRRTSNTAASRGSTVNMQVASYEGEDFVAAGAVPTPAQTLGASGVLDPEGTPWPDLPPLVFMQQTYLQVLALQGQRNEELLRERSLILLGETATLPMTRNPPPFPERDLLMAVKVRASELEEGLATAPQRTTNRPAGSAAEGSARGSPQPSQPLAAPVPEFSSRIDRTAFALRPLSSSAAGPSAHPSRVLSGFSTPLDSPAANPTTSAREGFPPQHQQQQQQQHQHQQQYPHGPQYNKQQQQQYPHHPHFPHYLQQHQYQQPGQPPPPQQPGPPPPPPPPHQQQQPDYDRVMAMAKEYVAGDPKFLSECNTHADQLDLWYVKRWRVNNPTSPVCLWDAASSVDLATILCGYMLWLSSKVTPPNPSGKIPSSTLKCWAVCIMHLASYNVLGVKSSGRHHTLVYGTLPDGSDSLWSLMSKTLVPLIVQDLGLPTRSPIPANQHVSFGADYLRMWNEFDQRFTNRNRR